MEAGLAEPSARWKVRYGLMLGLERVLTEDLPRTASGTELRRHQVDALTGMLTELIASTQHRRRERNGNGNGSGQRSRRRAELEEEAEDDFDAGFVDEGALEAGFHGADPGPSRRYRFRHPTASGKTIAAAGFVEAARELGVLILTHRRLLVSQFQRDLTTEGYGDRFTDAVMKGANPQGQARSRSRRTPGSRATARSSTAPRTTSSSATRRTPRSARRRAPRSAPSTSRSTSA